MSASTLGQSALPEFEDEFELEDEFEFEGEGFDLGGLVSGLLGEGEFEDEFELEDEAEFEYEDEWEGEFEDEAERMANPLRRVYPDAMMEHLGHAAAEAETEAEAEAFVGALVPLAARMVRAAAPHVARSTPHLVRGLSKVAHTLRRNPTTRQFVRVLPTVASRTTHSLARHAARGRPITPRQAVRTLAGHTNAVLSNPRPQPDRPPCAGAGPPLSPRQAARRTGVAAWRSRQKLDGDGCQGTGRLWPPGQVRERGCARPRRGRARPRYGCAGTARGGCPARGRAAGAGRWTAARPALSTRSLQKKETE